jgi:BirA family transcriptional regulator, biotin operon repressor / biotin---[acetyl-CoA-carboxylase] ligase
MEFSGYSPLKLANPFGAPLLRVAETSSTMEDARVLASLGASSGTTVVADFQSAGRGRFRDRSWSGERGRDLLFTIMLELDLAQAAAFPLRAGLAVCRAIEGLESPRTADFRIKWPNDVLADGKKVCGILCESSGGRYFAGIGVNCAAREFPPGLRHPATSLEAILGARVDRFDLLSRILDELSRSFSRPDWIPEVAERLYRRGQPLRFLEGRPEDGHVVEGVLAGLGKGGELLIEVAGAEIRGFASGEILPGAS